MGTSSSFLDFFVASGSCLRSSEVETVLSAVVALGFVPDEDCPPPPVV